MSLLRVLGRSEPDQCRRAGALGEMRSVAASGAGFEDEVERRFGGAAEAGEAAGGDDSRDAVFAGLGAQAAPTSCDRRRGRRAWSRRSRRRGRRGCGCLRWRRWRRARRSSMCRRVRGCRGRGGGADGIAHVVEAVEEGDEVVVACRGSSLAAGDVECDAVGDALALRLLAGAGRWSRRGSRSRRTSSWGRPWP